MSVSGEAGGPRRLTVVGNGAHRTGAPLSLLAILRRRPPGLDVRLVLVGGGPLVDDFRAVVDDLVVLAAPVTRGARPRRVVEEVAVVAGLRRAVVGRRAGTLVVNTVEYEASLALARRWPGPNRIAVREAVAAHGWGPRGRARVALVRGNRAARLAAVGEGQAREWAERLGRPVAHLANVYEPAPREAVAAAAAPDGGDGPVRFLVVGGRSAVKGVDLAVAAFARRRRPPGEAELVVAGGDFPPRVDGAVRWLGAVPDLARRMADLGDVLLGVSRTEPYSRAVVEAALAGLPLLAWTAGGYVEQLDQFGGWGVAPFDLDAMAARIDEVTALGRSGTAAAGAESRRRAATVHDPDRAAAAWWDWILTDP
ncbi:MAG: hypothetical protein QOG43_3322 [Actinomycetota bacterium]|nr:hypothetical protein [Actinomycetota bacterium]